MSPATPYPGNPPPVKKFFNWILLLAAIVGAFYGVGVIVPRSQKLGSYTNFMAKPREVYSVVYDVERWDEWHPDFADVREIDELDGKRRWRVTDHKARMFELVETEVEQDRQWQGTYEIEGTNFSYRIMITGSGSGSRVGLKKTLDTRDPWRRAKRFLWFGEGSTALGLLNALSVQLGEPAEAIKDND